MIKLDRIEDEIVSMADMEPLQVGIIVSGGNNGHVVIRNADRDRFEVLDLSDPGPNSCWLDRCMTVKVRLLPKGTKIVLTVV